MLLWVGRVTGHAFGLTHTAVFVLVFTFLKFSLNLTPTVDCILDLITLY